MIVRGIIKTNQEVCKILTKIALDSQKLAIKRALLDIFLALLASIHLYLAVQEFKIIESILDLVLFVDKFAQVWVDISTPKIGSLSRSNTRLAFK